MTELGDCNKWECRIQVIKYRVNIFAYNNILLFTNRKGY